MVPMELPSAHLAGEQVGRFEMPESVGHGQSDGRDQYGFEHRKSHMYLLLPDVGSVYHGSLVHGVVYSESGSEDDHHEVSEVEHLLDDYGHKRRVEVTQPVDVVVCPEDSEDGVQDAVGRVIDGFPHHRQRRTGDDGGKEVYCPEHFPAFGLAGKHKGHGHCYGHLHEGQDEGPYEVVPDCGQERGILEEVHIILESDEIHLPEVGPVGQTCEDDGDDGVNEEQSVKDECR